MMVLSRNINISPSFGRKVVFMQTKHFIHEALIFESCRDFYDDEELKNQDYDDPCLVSYVYEKKMKSKRSYTRRNYHRKFLNKNRHKIPGYFCLDCYFHPTKRIASPGAIVKMNFVKVNRQSYIPLSWGFVKDGELLLSVKKVALTMKNRNNSNADGSSCFIKRNTNKKRRVYEKNISKKYIQICNENFDLIKDENFDILENESYKSKPIDFIRDWW